MLGCQCESESYAIAIVHINQRQPARSATYPPIIPPSAGPKVGPNPYRACTWNKKYYIRMSLRATCAPPLCSRVNISPMLPPPSEGPALWVCMRTVGLEGNVDGTNLPASPANKRKIIKPLSVLTNAQPMFSRAKRPNETT